jgi:transcriptional regulator with XRE-family HTH domain
MSGEVLQPQDPQTFGARLAAVRTARQLPQVDLAELVTAHLIRAGLRDASAPPIGSWAISSWENDRHTPDLAKLVALCEVLQVSADVLLCLAPYHCGGYKAA